MILLVQWHNMGTSRCRRYRSLSTTMMLLLMLLLGTRNKWTHGAEEEQVCAATSNGEASESCKAAGGLVAASAIDTDSATRITGVNGDDNSAQDLKEEPPCTDDNEKCEPWADQGECKANPGYMNESCRRACRICKDPK